MPGRAAGCILSRPAALVQRRRVQRSDAREAEGAPLLREYRVKSSIEGSNPSHSASCQKARDASRGFFICVRAADMGWRTASGRRRMPPRSGNVAMSMHRPRGTRINPVLPWSHLRLAGCADPPGLGASDGGRWLRPAGPGAEAALLLLLPVGRMALPPAAEGGAGGQHLSRGGCRCRDGWVRNAARPAHDRLPYGRVTWISACPACGVATDACAGTAFAVRMDGLRCALRVACRCGVPGVRCRAWIRHEDRE